jgi:hypothetical protein
MLVLTLVIALLMGFWADGLRKRRNAVRLIEAVGGTVSYDTDPGNASSFERCVISLKRVAFGQPVASVGFIKVNDVRSVLPHLRNLNNIRSLFIEDSALSDAELDDIAALKSLRKLYLYESPMTDDGLRRIQGMTNLTDLYIWKTRVTDEGLRYLERLHELKLLVLSDCKGIDGSGLEHIASLRNIEELDLNGTRVSNKTLRYLVSLPKLRVIALGGSLVDREGVAYLRANLPSVEDIKSGDCRYRFSDIKNNGVWQTQEEIMGEAFTDNDFIRRNGR